MLCCGMLSCLMAHAVDTVTEPEKCLLHATPYEYAFLEKENLLITVNRGGVYAYDVASGERRWHRYLVSARGNLGVHFGKRQVLGWSDQGVFLLDAATGKETWWRRDKQCGDINNAVLSPDESRVLLICERGSILYGVAEHTQRVLPPISSFCGWFPGGRAVMCLAYDQVDDDKGMVRKWSMMDIDTGTVTPCREEPCAWDAPWPAVFSSLGELAELTGDQVNNQTLKISDARTGATLREFKDLGDVGRRPSWMKDGKRLFCVTMDRKEVRVIDAESGTTRIALSRDGHRFGVGSVFEDEAGDAWIFSKDAANNRYVWNLAPDGAPRKVLDGSRITPSYFCLFVRICG